MNEMTFLKNLDFIRTGGSKEEFRQNYKSLD